MLCHGVGEAADPPNLVLGGTAAPRSAPLSLAPLGERLGEGG